MSSDHFVDVNKMIDLVKVIIKLEALPREDNIDEEERKVVRKSNHF